MNFASLAVDGIVGDAFQECDGVMWRMVRRYLPHFVVAVAVLLLLYRAHTTQCPQHTAARIKVRR